MNLERIAAESRARDRAEDFVCEYCPDEAALTKAFFRFILQAQSDHSETEQEMALDALEAECKRARERLERRYR